MTASTLSAPTRSTASAPAASSRIARTVRDVGIFTGRALRHTLRNPEALLLAVVLPVMLMVMFAWVFGGAIDAGTGSYIDFVAPGIILTCAGYGASSTAVSVAQDLQTGLMDRFRTMPITASAVVTGHVLASLARNLVATAIVIGVAALLGYRPGAVFVEQVASPLAGQSGYRVGSGFLQWGLALGLIALYILAITYLFSAIGLASGNAEAANGYGFILLFLPYLSSGYVPVESMPKVLQPIAEHQPLTPVIDSIRALLDGNDPGSSLPIAALWCVGILAAAMIWANVAFRRRAGKR